MDRAKELRGQHRSGCAAVSGDETVPRTKLGPPVLGPTGGLIDVAMLRSMWTSIQVRPSCVFNKYRIASNCDLCSCWDKLNMVNRATLSSLSRWHCEEATILYGLLPCGTNI